MKKNYAPAYEHQPIERMFENVYWVHGSIKMAPGMTINRNMVILKNGSNLFLINPLRLNEKEEKKLKALGNIKAIYRLGDFHGIDDQYYIDTCSCDFFCQAGQSTYPNQKPDGVITQDLETPIDNAEFFIFSNALFPEAALLLRDHKLLITTDSIQNWTDWSYTNLPAKILLFFMGFRIKLLIGKPWLKRVTAKNKNMQEDFENLLKLDFDNLIAAHGTPLLGGAHERLKKIVKAEFQQ